MRAALLLPFSPNDSANSGVARLEMFDFFPPTDFTRYHFGPPAQKEDLSIGRYLPDGNPKNLLAFWRLYLAFRHAHRKKPYDLIWTTLPPITMAIFARCLATWFKIPLIVDARDPGIASAVLIAPPGSLKYRLTHALESWLYRKAKAICVTTPELADLLSREFKAPKERMTVISNATAIKVRPHHLPDPKKVKVFYAGTFAAYQVINQVIQNLLSTEPNRPFVFDFYGYQEEKEPELKAIAAKVASLHLRPRLPRPELFKYLEECDIALVPIAMPTRKELYDYAIPLKLYEALAFSRPILLYGGTAASRRLLKETGCGEICALGEDILPVLQKILNHYPRYQKAAAATLFSRKAEAAKLELVFSSLNKHPSP